MGPGPGEMRVSFAVPTTDRASGIRNPERPAPVSWICAGSREERPDARELEHQSCGRCCILPPGGSGCSPLAASQVAQLYVMTAGLSAPCRRFAGACAGRRAQQGRPIARATKPIALSSCMVILKYNRIETIYLTKGVSIPRLSKTVDGVFVPRPLMIHGSNERRYLWSRHLQASTQAAWRWCASRRFSRSPLDISSPDGWA